MLSILMTGWTRKVVTASILVALVGGLIYYIDKLCNDEKRALRAEVVALKKKIHTKNVALIEKDANISRIISRQKNATFEQIMECKRQQRRRNEVSTSTDATGNLYF